MSFDSLRSLRMTRGGGERGRSCAPIEANARSLVATLLGMTMGGGAARNGEQKGGRPFGGAALRYCLCKGLEGDAESVFDLAGRALGEGSGAVAGTERIAEGARVGALHGTGRGTVVDRRGIGIDGHQRVAGDRAEVGEVEEIEEADAGLQVEAFMDVEGVAEAEVEGTEDSVSEFAGGNGSDGGFDCARARPIRPG